MPDAFNKLANEAAQARRENRVSDARRYWTEAVQLCRQSGNKKELIQALKGSGQIERDMGNNDAALPFYEQAVALCREEHDPQSLAHTVRHLGDVYRSAGQLDLAEPCYSEALTIYRRHKQTAPLDFANALRPMAILKEQKGELQAAKPLWEEARQLYAAANVPEGVAESLKRLAYLAEKH
ncbi:MAG: tetratricopeptide repeat protein [Candidatus Acidiferrum sp.]|jgi:tetratricopeptide (TPR) repeat protein